MKWSPTPRIEYLEFWAERVLWISTLLAFFARPEKRIARQGQLANWRPTVVKLRDVNDVFNNGITLHVDKVIQGHLPDLFGNLGFRGSSACLPFPDGDMTIPSRLNETERCL
ncbi:hypothetical protein CC2G_006910 [Coprinopsis cinerea AmutBmut pab1-1]|nr:hypothetical protein CC2G_006910 [Coprinopsis cinerea AmutBmut pab1-1]